MRIVDPLVDELTMEAATTKAVLERVPEAHLAWRPHEKSMSLGQLAWHVATLPRQLTGFVTGDALDFSAAGSAPATASSHQLFAASRAAVLRSFLFNHWYHHRGQLLVYLRLLNVPVPSVYGLTADENPFADARCLVVMPLTSGR